MDYKKIEDETRRLQYEIWHQRQIIFPSGASPLHMFSPEVAARVLDVEYETRPFIASTGSTRRAAGQFDRQRGIISVSAEFSYEVQRFTGSHEIGHLLLHPQIGNGVAHREFPINGNTSDSKRPWFEQEADYFAACYLAPAGLVIKAFRARFGAEPLHLDDHSAFYLAGKQGRLLATTQPGSLRFGSAVAEAGYFGGPRFKPLTEIFGLTPMAMGIRLRELGLLAE